MFLVGRSINFKTKIKLAIIKKPPDHKSGGFPFVNQKTILSQTGIGMNPFWNERLAHKWQVPDFLCPSGSMPHCCYGF